jgi:hypothetical protein
LGYFQAFLQCPEGKKKGSVALVHRPSGSRGNRVPAFCKLHRSVVIMQRCQWETRTGPQGLLCACSLPEGNKNHQIPVRGKKYKCVPHETIRHGKMRTQCRRSSWLRADPKRQAALWFGAVGRALRLSFAFFGAAFFPRFARSLPSRSKKKQPKKLGHTEARLGNANKNAIGAKTVCLLKGAHEEGGLRRSHGPSRQIRSLQRRQKNLLSLLFWRARAHTHTHTHTQVCLDRFRLPSHIPHASRGKRFCETAHTVRLGPAHRSHTKSTKEARQVRIPQKPPYPLPVILALAIASMAPDCFKHNNR